MDDYSTNILSDSKNEWSIVLMNNLVPHIIDGIRSIFNQSVELCNDNNEIEKYLLTFQNLLSRIPKWSQTMIDTEKERIVKLCNCSYLEDILTCVYIIQLKVLSCVRVGVESKKINIDIPDLGTFIHQVYINVARKLYSNIYLFEIDIPSLDIQKRNREFEILVQTCIMNTIRDKMPIEKLLRQYIDSTQEVEITKVERVIDTKPMDIEPKQVENIQNKKVEPKQEFIEEPLLNSNNNMNNMEISQPLKQPYFQVKENIFDIPEPPKVGFSDKNSILEFDTPNDEAISLGEPTNVDFEDLEIKNENVEIDLNFEEL